MDLLGRVDNIYRWYSVTTMIFFLDIEASSLDSGSYPIEIAWVDTQGFGESHLIQPESAWTNWSPVAESIHGISREQLARDGKPAGEVAQHVWDVLKGHVICARDPAFDEYWLSLLLSVIGREPLRIVDLNATVQSEAALPQRIGEVVLRVFKEDDQRQRLRHRAWQDADSLRWCWQQVRDRLDD